MRDLLLGFAALVGAAAIGAPAAGQETLDELTVVGRLANAPQSKSYRVRFGDIDLRTKAGETELARRVDVTAAYVCGQLGLPAEKASTCKRQAIFDTRPAVRAAIASAKASKVAWKPGRGWTPPPAS